MFEATAVELPCPQNIAFLGIYLLLCQSAGGIVSLLPDAADFTQDMASPATRSLL